MEYLLHQGLRESARRDPKRVAVVDGERRITYGELDRRSDILASFLRARGVRRGDRVAIYTPKSLEAVLAIFAALKAGGVYVPVDPQAPPRRAAYILQNCAVRCLVAAGRLLKGLEPHWPAGRNLGAIVTTDEGEAPASFAHVPVTPLAAAERSVGAAPPADEGIDADLAYILYTSGSTGDPKGVMLTHRHAVNFVDWGLQTFGVGPQDHVSSHAPFHFDLSIFDIFVSLKAGGTLVLVPDGLSAFPVRLAEFIENQAISVWYSVPSALTLLVTRGDLGRFRLSRLRAVLFAGEVFPLKYLRALKVAVPHAALYNLYGPTETNVCTYYRVPDDLEALDGTLSIGRACANTEVFAVNGDGRPIGPGEEGELFVRGAALMKGYWGLSERTAKTLRQNPLHTDYEDTAYATGDIVKLGPDGNYLFLGRRDNMIKSRGYRIELGEIEAALTRHPAVAETGAVAVPDEQIGNRIVAFVSPQDGVTLAEGELRRHAAETLPRYMVPERILVERELPKTSTGKIDRQTLRRWFLEGATAPGADTQPAARAR